MNRWFNRNFQSSFVHNYNWKLGVGGSISQQLVNKRGGLVVQGQLGLYDSASKKQKPAWAMVAHAFNPGRGGGR